MRRKIALVFFALVALIARAQFNVDRLMTSGQIALHYEDYVLSMQYFNQIISLKPYLYQPWQYRAIAKYYLDDYVGACVSGKGMGLLRRGCDGRGRESEPVLPACSS